MVHLFFRCGALFAGLSVIMGAYAAHGGAFSDTQAIWLEKATRYQMYHAIGLILTAISLALGKTGSLAVVAGWCFIGGIILFSGSLYIMTFFPIRLGAITPLGGSLMIAGWVLLCIAGLGKQGHRD